jgi:hypothetical protein
LKLLATRSQINVQARFTDIDTHPLWLLIHGTLTSDEMGQAEGCALPCSMRTQRF